MKRKTIILATFALFFCAFAVYAQTNLLEKADEQFNSKNYAEAIKIYTRIFQDAEENEVAYEVMKKIGIAYMEMNQFKPAIKYFKKYSDINSSDDTARYDLGQLYLKTGDIESAKNIFTALKQKHSDEEEYKRMVECCNFALSERAKPNKPPIKNQELINTPQSEFGLAFFDNKLIFASHKITDNFSTISGRIDQGYADIYSARFDSLMQVYTEPEKLSGKINSTYNDGTFTYNPETKTAYFTQCRKNPDLCKIFKTQYEKGKWQEISSVNLGEEGFNYAHPSLTSDGKTLYFASDLPGGLGGQDIWKVEIAPDGTIKKPVNLGDAINTDKDEMFPFIVGDSILLYSSEGRIGMGGLDIFYSKIENGLFDRPVNVGAPINSTADDFSVLLKENLSGGLFCSNRNNEEKSDDIFSFNHNIFLSNLYGKVVDSLTFSHLVDVKIIYATNEKDVNISYSDSVGNFYMPGTAHATCNLKHTLTFQKEGYIPKTIKVPCYAEDDMVVFMDDGSGQKHTLSGNITNKKNGKAVAGALVTVRSLRGQNTSANTDKDGNFDFNTINPDDYIVLRASKKGFLSDSRVLKTPGNLGEVEMSTEKGYDTSFELIPIEFEVEFEIENIYYEFDKARLLPASRFSLNKLANLLSENPQIKIQINSHADERGTAQYNLSLSHRRSASVVKYLIDAGINRSRLLSRGYGESQPIIVNARTEAEHQKNRRTAFEILGEINVAATGSGALYDIPGAPSSPEDELFERIRQANRSGELMSNESLLDLKIKTDIVKNGDQAKENENSDIVNVVNETKIKSVAKPQAPSGSKIYRVQIVATSKEIDLKTAYPKISDLVDKHNSYVVKASGLNKYQLGNFTDRKEAEDLKLTLAKRGFAQCFIVTIDQ